MHPAWSEHHPLDKRISGEVIRVIDGDTIVVLDQDQRRHKIRLAEIDTPEKSQAFGNQAKKALSEKIFGKNVVVAYTDYDRYDRILGKIRYDGRLINHEMVEEGWAWHYRKYSDDEELAGAEDNARKSLLGLWNGKNPIPPWEYRHSTRDKSDSISEANEKRVEPGSLTHWLNTGSGVRHNKRCRWFSNTKRGKLAGPNGGRACGNCGG